MAEQAAVAFQQGIWIDQRRLAEAGLRDPFEIIVQAGKMESGRPSHGRLRDRKCPVRSKGRTR